jgi:hypothetical protein
VPGPPLADSEERRRRFEAVYDAHRSAILGYALRRTGSPDDAADVIAETFLTAWRRLDDVPSEPEAPPSPTWPPRSPPARPSRPPRRSKPARRPR